MQISLKARKIFDLDCSSSSLLSSLDQKCWFCTKSKLNAVFWHLHSGAPKLAEKPKIVEFQMLFTNGKQFFLRMNPNCSYNKKAR